MAKLFFLFDIWLMSLVTRVKVGNITSLSEARYCAGMGVDFLGFRLGKNGLTGQAYQDIIGWISVPNLVLEAHRDTSLTLEDITTNFPGHYIEINKQQLSWLPSPHSFILCLKTSEWASVAPEIKGKPNIAFIELERDDDSQPSISTYPVMLRVNNTRELEDALQSHAAAISLDGSPEQKPGLMDYGFVGEVLENLSEQ
jgi:phosphoribosylanthranilate isomerase